MQHFTLFLSLAVLLVPALLCSPYNKNKSELLSWMMREGLLSQELSLPDISRLSRTSKSMRSTVHFLFPIVNKQRQRQFESACGSEFSQLFVRTWLDFKTVSFNNTLIGHLSRPSCAHEVAAFCRTHRHGHNGLPLHLSFGTRVEALKAWVQVESELTEACGPFYSDLVLSTEDLLDDSITALVMQLQSEANMLLHVEHDVAAENAARIIEANRILVLSVHLNQLSAMAIQRLAEAFAAIPDKLLDDLEVISSMTIPHAFIDAIADIKTLRTVYIATEGLGDKGLLYTLARLLQHQTLGQLQLTPGEVGSSTFGDDGSDSDASSSSDFSVPDSLRDLIIDGFKNNWALVDLDLQGAALHPKLLHVILEGLAGNRHIKILNLNDNQLRVAELEMLTAALRNNHALNQLELAGCISDSQGIPYITRILAEHPGLKSIDLDGNSIDDEGVVALSGSLMHVESLDLASNVIGEAGVRVLAHAIKNGRAPHLTQLVLNNNEIGNRGVAALCHAFASHPSFVDLRLESCDLDDEALPSLKRLVEGNSHLERLVLTENLFSLEFDAQYNLKRLKEYFREY